MKILEIILFTTLFAIVAEIWLSIGKEMIKTTVEWVLCVINNDDFFEKRGIENGIKTSKSYAGKNSLLR